MQPKSQVGIIHVLSNLEHGGHRASRLHLEQIDDVRSVIHRILEMRSVGDTDDHCGREYLPRKMDAKEGVFCKVGNILIVECDSFILLEWDTGKESYAESWVRRGYSSGVTADLFSVASSIAPFVADQREWRNSYRKSGGMARVSQDYFQGDISSIDVEGQRPIERDFASTQGRSANSN